MADGRVEVVRLQWLVECVRQGKEVPLTDELVWQGGGWQCCHGRTVERSMQAVATDMEQDESHSRQDVSAGNRGTVTGAHFATRVQAPTLCHVEMREEVQQPRHSIQPQQRGMTER